MIYFTSDTHYNHKNIVQGTSEWEIARQGKRVRQFPDLESHNNTLVDRINSKVKADDILYHLGDWSFGGFASVKEFRDRLNCKNIHFIYGNHDHHIESNTEDCQQLFTSVQHYKEISVGGNRIVLFHYAMRVWNHSHKGTWMLYGHSHGSLDAMTPEIANPTWIGDMYFIKNWKTMDVGVDTNDMYPYSFEEIREIMNKKSVLLGVDHHGT